MFRSSTQSNPLIEDTACTAYSVDRARDYEFDGSAATVLRADTQMVPTGSLSENGVIQRETTGSQRRLHRVLEFIDMHCDRPLSVETLAEVACLSKSHFARFFKAATGMSPHRLISERRIAYAKLLLEDPKKPVLSVALICHFSSHANFCKTFRRVTGMTPGQYRAAAIRRATAHTIMQRGSTLNGAA
ncbi:MAG: AraC family transcriptional regulator [Dyella sp.]